VGGSVVLVGNAGEGEAWEVGVQVAPIVAVCVGGAAVSVAVTGGRPAFPELLNSITAAAPNATITAPTPMTPQGKFASEKRARGRAGLAGRSSIFMAWPCTGSFCTGSGAEVVSGVNSCPQMGHVAALTETLELQDGQRRDAGEEGLLLAI
jgi:hypothetical protein